MKQGLRIFPEHAYNIKIQPANASGSLGHIYGSERDDLCQFMAAQDIAPAGVAERVAFYNGVLRQSPDPYSTFFFQEEVSFIRFDRDFAFWRFRRVANPVP